jgi:hypothetical protein
MKKRHRSSNNEQDLLDCCKQKLGGMIKVWLNEKGGKSQSVMCLKTCSSQHQIHQTNHQKNNLLNWENFGDPWIHDADGNRSTIESSDLLIQQGFCMRWSKKHWVGRRKGKKKEKRIEVSSTFKSLNDMANLPTDWYVLYIIDYTI